MRGVSASRTWCLHLSVVWAAALATLLSIAVREADACTALAIEGEASETGSGFAVENVDCNNCDFRLAYVPPRDYEQGTKRPVYLQKAVYPRWVGYGRGEIYHPLEGQTPFEAATHIPQVEHTYGYYESACPLMNDQGLGIAESSCAAFLLNKAPTDKTDNRSVPVAILDAAALMQLVLERCATARCGAELMGQLCETYGYLPFFGEPTPGRILGRSAFDDAGEAYTLVDKTGESWVVHVLGGVEGVIKSVWAAQRVPKGHVAVIANDFIIGDLPDEPNDDFLFGKNVHRAAIEAGLWDGKGTMHFTNTFAPDDTYFEAPSGSIPIPLYGALRKWRLLSLVAPSLNLKLPLNAKELPFSVKAEKKLSHRDVMEMMKDHYKGTEFDMSQGILAGPFGTPFRLEGGPKFGQVPRGISIFRSIYSMIAQSGPQGSWVWFGPDTAATSVYVPLDSRTGALDASYHTGTYTNFTRESAFWAFDFVNNWMQLNYKGMMEQDVGPRQQKWQDVIDKEREEKNVAAMTAEEVKAWQLGVQRRVVADWWTFSDQLVMKWNDMSHSHGEVTEGTYGYPADWAKMVGFTNSIHPLWVKPAPRPEPLEAAPGYVPACTSLPQQFDQTGMKWVDYTVPVCSLEEAAAANAAEADAAAQLVAPAATQQGMGPMHMTVFGVVVFIAGSFSGFAVGRRGGVKAENVYEHLLA
eukprot:TRINITY_DN3833_c0_g1_i1.p1 TRINITY_DN3833_c0_g1~~TRINITY_DN3833_c0_g1_i1.p1  ORF type:complete len:696 (+),score=161.97 TRINITY_DN3833_c0_g1_i1:65-2152(+)